MKSESFWLCIESNPTDMLKAKKRSKDIIKIVHLTSGFNHKFTKLRKYFCAQRKPAHAECKQR